MSPCVSSGTQPEVLPKTSFLRAYAANDQFDVLGLERARPKRRLRGGDLVFERKIRVKKMASDVPEIKLVNLLKLL